MINRQTRALVQHSGRFRSKKRASWRVWHRDKMHWRVLAAPRLKPRLRVLFHQLRLLALPVFFFFCLAFIVLLLPLGKTDFELDHAV